VGDVDVRAARNEEVDVAVAIVVAPSSAGAEAAAADARFFGEVLELAVPEVAIEDVAAVAGDEEV
jgi:hypothetical protein